MTGIIRLQNWNLRQDAKPNGDSIEKSIADLNHTKLPTDDQVNWYSQSAEAPWSKRRLDVANEVRFAAPACFTVNEALVRQVIDLKELLAPMLSLGVGRDDGKEAGEFQAIFYDPAKVDLIEWETYWMSNTPSKPSKFPGAGSTRSATVAHFKEKVSGIQFTLINVHLDDQSDEQRRLGAAMARLRGGYEYQKGHPVFVVGDFNSNCEGKDSGAYKIITGALDYDYEKIEPEFRNKYANSYESTFVFDDLLLECPPVRRSGHLATFTGFKPQIPDLKRIDFQFGGNPRLPGVDRLWDVEFYRVLDNWPDYSYYLSDHRAVVGEVVIRKQ